MRALYNSKLVVIMDKLHFDALLFLLHAFLHVVQHAFLKVFLFFSVSVFYHERFSVFYCVGSDIMPTTVPPAGQKHVLLMPSGGYF